MNVAIVYFVKPIVAMKIIQYLFGLPFYYFINTMWKIKVWMR